jgi:hypothetical protein
VPPALTSIDVVLCLCGLWSTTIIDLVGWKLLLLVAATVVKKLSNDGGIAVMLLVKTMHIVRCC